MELPLVGRDEEIDELSRFVHQGGAVVLSGPSGVGKTRLAREAEQLARPLGIPVETVMGSSTARSLLFGATSHLVAPSGARDPHDLLASTVRALGQRAADRGLVLIIDDADLLDSASATLVQHVVRDRVATVVATVRTDSAQVPDVIVSLWSDLGAERVDVAPLERRFVRALLEGALGGEVGADLEAQVWRLSRGYPLYIREMLVAARASGTFRQGDDGVWRTTGDPAISLRLTELVRSRLELLPADLRDAVERVALAEPIARATVEAVIGLDRLDALERDGLLVEETNADRAFVRLAHPLQGEALREMVTPSRGAAVATVWADAIAARPTADGDRLRAATLLLDAGRQPDAGLALAAAREALARFDGSLAERLARMVVEADPRSAASTPGEVVLGIALQLQGRLDEADRVLRAASRTAQTDDERTEAALARARNLHWAMGDRAAALRVLDDELGRVEDEAAKGALETEAALFHAVVGALDRAESVAAEALQRSGLGPRTELNALVVLTLAYCVQGRLGELSSVLDRALELARAHRADEPLAEGQLLLNHAHTLMFDDVERSWLLARRYAAQPSPLLGMWRATVGLCELAMGRVTDAVVTLREATHRLQRMDPFGNLDMVRCMHALATARLRDAEGLRRTLGQVDRDLAEREPRTRLWLRRAEACGHGLAGEFDLASDIAAHAGEEAIAASHLTWGAEALYDAVRFGAADRVATSLEELAKQTDVTVIRLFADHAAALAGRDAAGLERVATRLVAANRPLAAAEAFAQAAGSIDPEEGDRHAGSLLRAAALTRRSPGAWVVALDAHGAALSAREAEIATLVAQGLTNRDIAERLFLSHRTVENHLARVYGRFGLTGRDQLRRALGDRFVGKTP